MVDNIEFKEFEDICPRCKVENTYRTFMCDNHRDKKFTFRSFCGNCNSFAYKVIKDANHNLLKMVEVQFSCNDYIVTLLVDANKTTIRGAHNMVDIINLPKLVKFDLTSPSKDLEEKIKTYLLFI